MNFLNYKSRVWLTTCLVASLLPAASGAQDWPSRTIRLVVPVPTGGGLDPFARAIAEKLTVALKQNFVVDNKPGASGAVGTGFVATSAPDGYTFGFVYDTHAVNATLMQRMTFDTLKDLTPIMLLGRSPQVLASSNKGAFNTFKDVVIAARAKPGVINIGTPGNGSIGHLSVLQLARDEDVKLNNIPYKGGGPLLQDLVGGTLDLGIAGVPNMISAMRNGLIRPLAVTSKERSAALPDVPTLAELGIKGLDSYTWWGLLAPAGTPQPIIDRMHAAVATAMQSPNIKKMFTETLAMESIASTPKAFQQFLVKETADWGRVIRDNKVRADE